MANISLHIVFYATVILIFVGVLSIFTKRKLRAMLWLSLNTNDSLYKSIDSRAQEFGFMRDEPGYNSMKDAQILEWWKQRKRAEKIVRGSRGDIFARGGFFSAVLILTLTAFLGSAILILFLDSLSLDFTRFFEAVDTLRG